MNKDLREFKEMERRMLEGHIRYALCDVDKETRKKHSDEMTYLIGRYADLFEELSE